MVNQLILETSLREDQFSDRQKKKKNMAIVHKKEDKNLLENYYLISLLPVFSKIFERVTYNPLFNFFSE